jgi:hypothetical protein
MNMNLTSKAGDDGAKARTGGPVPAALMGVASGFGGWAVQSAGGPPWSAAVPCRRGGAGRRMARRAGRGCPRLVKSTTGWPVGAANCLIMPLTVSTGAADNPLLFER